MSPTQRAQTLTRPASQDEQDVAENWRSKAACRTADPELFFDEHTAEARKICNTQCPVRETCLQDALDTRDFYGVRGGRTSRQRKFLSMGTRPLLPAVTKANLARSEKGARTRATILTLAQSGLDPQEIATEIGITRSTVWSYLRALRDQGELPESTRRNGPKPKPIKHGSRSGYYTHRDRKEIPCEECFAGMRQYETSRREARKAAGL